MTKHNAFMMTGEGVGSSVEMIGPHPSLSDVAL